MGSRSSSKQSNAAPGCANRPTAKRRARSISRLCGWVSCRRPQALGVALAGTGCTWPGLTALAAMAGNGFVGFSWLWQASWLHT